MAKYLIEASYRAEGIAGLLKEGGTGRRTAVDELFSSLGGTVESMYYAFGDQDVYIVGDLPDNTSAAALSMKVNATGAAACKTIVLMTPQEIDIAIKKSSRYRPPGHDLPPEEVNWEGEGGHLKQDESRPQG
jgi:uncharacterized protein with GYD domain